MDKDLHKKKLNAAVEEFYNARAKKSRKYLNEFIRLKCSVDMLKEKLFPNAKEITESFGVYAAVKNNFHELLSDKDAVFVVVGDGGTPRTAATFAYRTAGECYSIDPQLNVEKKRNINRLHMVRGKVQDVGRKDIPKGKRFFILPHAHVSECDIEHLLGKGDSVIALPCCVNYKAKNPLNLVYQYTDHAIQSPKNEIFIYQY